MNVYLKYLKELRNAIMSTLESINHIFFSLCQHVFFSVCQQWNQPIMISFPMDRSRSGVHDSSPTPFGDFPAQNI